MPFITAKTSCPISKGQETKIKARMGKVIELVPGKSEESLLLEFEDNCRLWLLGENTEPITYIEAAIFGNELHDGYDAFTAAMTNIFADVLNLTPDRIYIKYEDIPAWEVQGMHIDRNQYR